MASPPSPDAAGAAVCCMCGDHGLARELFHCKSCRVRLQHSYCSDLYPRAASYRRCNWCLREPPLAQGGGAAGHAVPVADNNKHTVKTTSSSVSGEERYQGQQRGCSWSRRPPPAERGRLAMKKRKADDEDGVRPSSGAAKWKSNDTGNDDDSKEMMRAWKTRVRSKAPRYKLLAEVISC